MSASICYCYYNFGFASLQLWTHCLLTQIGILYSLLLGNSVLHGITLTKRFRLMFAAAAAAAATFLCLTVSQQNSNKPWKKQAICRQTSLPSHSQQWQWWGWGGWLQAVENKQICMHTAWSSHFGQ